MVEQVWIVAAIAVVVLLQFAVYTYLRRREDAPSLDVRAGNGPSSLSGPAEGASPSRETDGGRRCPTCGTVNDPAFTFCRNCTARIGA